MTALLASETPIAIDRAAAGDYVLRRRTSWSGRCFYRFPRPSVDERNVLNTLAALASLRILGIGVPEPSTTGEWLRSLQRDDGRYPTITTGWAALRSLDLLGMRPGHSPLPWLQYHAASLQPHGDLDWPNALRDTLRLAELLRLTGAAHISSLHQTLTGLLDSARDPLGGWARPGADLETTAIALRLIRLTGLPLFYPADVISLLRDSEDPRLGFRVCPSTRATSVDALWGGLDMAHALRVSPRYPAAIGESLALLQRPDGGLGPRRYAMSTLRDTWRGLAAASLLDHLPEE